MATIVQRRDHVNNFRSPGRSSWLCYRRRVTATPEDVRLVSVVGYFDALCDAVIQRKIDVVTPIFSAPIMLAYSQRDEVIAWYTAHLLWLQIQAETPGGGGGGAPLSSVKLEGAATMSWAVGALQPADMGDPLKSWSPFLATLGKLIADLPVGLTLTSPGALGGG